MASSARGFTQAVYSDSLPRGKKKSATLNDVLHIFFLDVSHDSLPTVRHSPSSGRSTSKIPLQRAQTVRTSPPASFHRVSRWQGGVV
jgi:hypothetical protein